MNTPITSQSSMQEIFNRVARHLLTQNARASQGEAGDCMYRTDDGLKCAVGCLITDDAYSLELENLLVSRAPVREALEASGIVVEPNGPTHKILSDLQRVHDTVGTSNWPEELRSIATHYRLDHSVIKSKSSI